MVWHIVLSEVDDLAQVLSLIQLLIQKIARIVPALICLMSFALFLVLLDYDKELCADRHQVLYVLEREFQVLLSLPRQVIHQVQVLLVHVVDVRYHRLISLI